MRVARRAQGSASRLPPSLLHLFHLVAPLPLGVFALTSFSGSDYRFSAASSLTPRCSPTAPIGLPSKNRSRTALRSRSGNAAIASSSSGATWVHVGSSESISAPHIASPVPQRPGLSAASPTLPAVGYPSECALSLPISLRSRRKGTINPPILQHPRPTIQQSPSRLDLEPINSRNWHQSQATSPPKKRQRGTVRVTINDGTRWCRINAFRHGTVGSFGRRVK
jgi:hypothetical protein